MATHNLSAFRNLNRQVFYPVLMLVEGSNPKNSIVRRQSNTVLLAFMFASTRIVVPSIFEGSRKSLGLLGRVFWLKDVMKERL